MQFNTGSPSLVSYTREIINDPSTAPRPLFSDTRVKDVINDVYQEAFELARQYNTTFGQIRSYTDTVASQQFYQLPSDASRIITVEVAGGDLTDPAVYGTFLKPIDSYAGLQAMESNTGVVSPTHYFLHGQHIGLIAPTSDSVTNGMRLTYEASTGVLVADADTPVLPTQFHSWLCHEAGLLLLQSANIDPGYLALIAGRKRAIFQRWLSDRLKDSDGQMVVEGLNTGSEQTLQGYLDTTNG